MQNNHEKKNALDFADFFSSSNHFEMFKREKIFFLDRSLDKVV